MYRPIPGAPPEVYDVEGRDNLVGPKSVATPGSLRAWCLALGRYGTMSLADVMQPAIRHASRGFVVTPYLSDCIAGASPDLLQDPFIADRLLPDGDAAEARRAPGAGRLCRGADPDFPAGRRGAAWRAAGRPRRRMHGTLRRLRRPKRSHRLSRGRAQADPRPVSRLGNRRAAAARRLGRAYHADAEHPRRLRHRRARLRHGRRHPSAGRGPEDRLRRPRPGQRRSRLRQGAGRAHHLQGLCPGAPRRHRSRPRPALDRRPAARWKGRTPRISPSPTAWATSSRTTQTINSLFGACFIVPGTGMVPNNYMSNFDPRPGNALSIAPGKRVTTSMSPMMARARRPGRLCAGPARRPQDLPRRLPGAGQPDRPRHGAAGGGRGAAGLDRRARARGRARHSGKRSRRACKPAVTRCR